MSPLTRLLRAFDRTLDRLERLLLALVAAMMVAIMLLVSLDAVLRYFLSSPLGFVHDLVLLYLLPGSMFLAFSATLKRGGHVAVDVLEQVLPWRFHRLGMGLLLIVAALVTGGITWLWLLNTQESWAAKLATTGTHSWPIWPSQAIVPAGMGILTIRAVQIALGHLAAAISGRRPAGDPAPAAGHPPKQEDTP
ncbi:TRAP transporter small permease subunit [Salipiger sp. P9]|uniref:TRAP transporter small permease n=1 Tax=Salipiger pentaromativorans TaxID=2943193 RepID=UPI0021570077|nr:TRAP transporter small permease subunit [Salipiger pentaromativorans]MCR8551110.1 TRAP transporter small permease subunit [Salipiger pentaromativorans]